MDYTEGTKVYHPAHGTGQVALSSEEEFMVTFDSGEEEVFPLGKSAAELPIVLHPEGFHILHRDNPEGLAELARTDPAGLVVRVTRDYKNQLPISLLEKIVKGRAVKDEEWDGWLKTLLSALCHDARFDVTGRTAVAYRGEVEEISLDLLERFRRAAKMKDKLRVCREVIRAGEQGVPIERNRETAVIFFTNVVRNDANLAGARIEALQALQVVSPADAEQLAGELREYLKAIPLTEYTDLIVATSESAVRREFLNLLREVRPDDFSEIITTLLKRYRRLRDWTLDYLLAGDIPTLRGLSEIALKNVSTNLEVFLWICAAFFKDPSKLESIGGEPIPLLRSMFKQLSRSHLTGAFSTRPKDGPYVSQEEGEILNLLGNSKNLKRFIKAVEGQTAKEFLRHYSTCSAVSEDDRKANLKELMAARPEIEGEYDTRAPEDEKHQITRETFDKYKEEYRKLIEEDIPQNIEDIRIAREWGDLRENAEYQTARDKQGLLQARKALLERTFDKCEIIE